MSQRLDRFASAIVKLVKEISPFYVFALLMFKLGLVVGSLLWEIAIESKGGYK